MGRVVQADILVFAVSGFLGKASDWDAFRSSLNQDFDLKSIDLFSPSILKTTSLSSFNFAEHLLKETQSVSNNYKKKIFLGYSFGGRLGLKLLQHQSNLFDEWVFVSTNVGLLQDKADERAARIENDKNWARKMTLGNWSGFISEWNAQAVFKGSANEPERVLKDFDIALLRHALVSQSLGLQPDFRQLVKENAHKIHWLVGNRDEKYLAMAEEMKSLGFLDKFVTLTGSHRLTYDAPSEISHYFNEKLKAHK